VRKLVARTGLYESPYELERSYRERLRLVNCEEAYIERVMAFGRKAAQSIRSHTQSLHIVVKRSSGRFSPVVSRDGLSHYSSMKRRRISV
jgi:hypothetical protein